MQTCESFITKATVYTHSTVQITRFSEVEISESGEVHLYFPITASRVEENSIQVKGGGQATLKDVKLVNKLVTEEQHEGIKALALELKPLLQQQKQLLAQKSRVGNEENFLAQLTQKLLTPQNNNKQPALEPSPDKWKSVLDFYRTRQESIDSENQQADQELEALELKINHIKEQIQQLQNGSSKSVTAIEVALDAQEAGKLQFELTYLCSGANWLPTYDIRVDSESYEIQIAYHAMVKNNTGEDWNDVKVSLSTAKPNINSTPPQLHPWFLRKYEPRRAMAGSAPRMAKKMAAMPARMEAMAELEESAAPMELQESTVESKGSSVLFHAGSLTTILSDNQAQRVTVVQEMFKADFHYISIPSRSTHAYLKAKVTNESDYPLLKGQANIFMDGHFVAKSNIDFIAPNKSFELDLGIDENISIEYKELEHYWTKEGSIILKNKKKITLEYLTEIQNNKQQEIKIIVSSAIPKSTNQEIQVDLITPIPNEEDIVLDDQSILKWTKKIAAQDTLKLSLKYSVQYPNEVETEFDHMYFEPN